MPAEIKMSFDKSELRELNTYIKEVMRNGNNTRPIMTFAVSVMSTSAIENFREQGREPHKWRGLAESTIEARERRGTWPGNILEEFGQLKQSLLPSIRGRGSFLQISRSQVEYGTRLTKARALQHGYQKRNLPARPFLYFRNEDVKKIMSFTFTYAFMPKIAARFGSAPKVESVPENLLQGFG